MHEGEDIAYAVDMNRAVTIHGDNSEELIEYLAPAPPKKTGKHRYVFVLLEPKNGRKGELKLKKPKERAHWGYGKKGAGVMEWADENELVAVGKPNTLVT